ncbi:transcriptional regulator [Arthrobacter oryzae]|uniref:Transcriptional regulator n=1 Tax=Arthrobacter oryzae TaxID=409290 RepID=A0A3N0CK82_9MICC|nr:transcriptional regulator [Arthrobacter oryzae]
MRRGSGGVQPHRLLLNALVVTNVLRVLDVLEVAAEPNRRKLLHRLASGELAAGELAAGFSVSRSAISQHLLLLEKVGLVTARKQGRHRYYRLDPGGMGRLRQSVDRFWTDELGQLAADALSAAEQRKSPGVPQ